MLEADRKRGSWERDAQKELEMQKLLKPARKTRISNKVLDIRSNNALSGKLTATASLHIKPSAPLHEELAAQ